MGAGVRRGRMKRDHGTELEMQQRSRATEALHRYQGNMLSVLAQAFWFCGARFVSRAVAPLGHADPSAGFERDRRFR